MTATAFDVISPVDETVVATVGFAGGRGIHRE
jgi:hypothetical protein